jgi:hypothetical protein
VSPNFEEVLLESIFSLKRVMEEEKERINKFKVIL